MNAIMKKKKRSRNIKYMRKGAQSLTQNESSKKYGMINNVVTVILNTFGGVGVSARNDLSIFHLTISHYSQLLSSTKAS